MKTIQIIQTVAVLFMAAASTLYAQTTVRVTADSVNLRAKPQLENSEVLAQANYDDHLAARDIGEEWIEVDAPPSVNLWISKEYVQVPENTIGARRVNVRAGPSINYNIVDTLERGTPIEPRDEVSGWLKIAPPPSSRVYIHREFVEILSDPPQAVAAAPAAEPEPRRQRKDKTRKPEDVATAHPVPPAAPVPPPAEIPTPIV
ncbi:MAG: SH3 domain-containing protein, partial [Lentisphaerae bacterium]|nr:SH3 domain-containing protein [Lentisphaerota bacterium]